MLPYLQIQSLSCYYYTNPLFGCWASESNWIELDYEPSWDANLPPAINKLCLYSSNLHKQVTEQKIIPESSGLNYKEEMVGLGGYAPSVVRLKGVYSTIELQTHAS